MTRGHPFQGYNLKRPSPSPSLFPCLASGIPYMVPNAKHGKSANMGPLNPIIIPNDEILELK